MLIENKKETLSLVPQNIMLVLSPLLSLIAIIWQGPYSLIGLSFINLSLIILSRQPFASWYKPLLLASWQCVIVTSLYLLRFGLSGLQPGLLVSWRLFLVFLPGMILLKTISPSQAMHTMRRILPEKPAFIATTCLHFFPLLWREIQNIYEVQVLRGARILPKDLLNPLNWKDVVSCLAAPVVTQCFVLAGEIADAAHLRWLGMKTDRAQNKRENNEQ